MHILSIQSHVVYGHVGNAAAVFPLQRLGVEVWPLHTVQFSNHTGYGSWKGRVFDGHSIDELMQGIKERDVLSKCDGVLSGYMGSPDLGFAILNAVKDVKEANPNALYCCDTVIGDVGRGIFVRPGVPEFMVEHALEVADIITPNHFELEYLSNQKVEDISALKEAVLKVQSKGPKIILVTSVDVKETPNDSLDLVASIDGKFWRVRTPRLNLTLSGSGDVTAALFYAHYLRSRSVKVALSEVSASIYGLLKRTEMAASREMVLIDAQEEIINPTWRFEIEEI
jgi:pyridoxine kinase